MVSESGKEGEWRASQPSPAALASWSPATSGSMLCAKQPSHASPPSQPTSETLGIHTLVLARPWNWAVNQTGPFPGALGMGEGGGSLINKPHAMVRRCVCVGTVSSELAQEPRMGQREEREAQEGSSN